MKKFTILVMIVSGFFLSGCEAEQKIDQVIEKLDEISTSEVPKGVPCDDAGALKVLKRIVDRKFDGDFEIEKENIVIWDYNPVGRYTCKAKIKKASEQKEKQELPKDETAAMFTVMNQMFAPANYGISSDGGWVNYYTYTTTNAKEKDRHLYVELFTEANEN